MAPELHSLTLGAVCSKIGSGATPRGGKDAYRGGATALIRSQNIHNYGFVHDGLVFIDDDQANELRNVVVEDGDVLLNITGDSVARCCQVDAAVLPARVNQHVAIIRPNPEILDARFLRYLIVSPIMQAKLLGLASAGATRNALTKGMIETLKINAPTLAQQRLIARILGTLDDKIELNRKTNATLEAMARALFKSWFVDFEPVRAKAEGRAPIGMDAETARLFPSEFVQSELGNIPKGWSIASLQQMSSYLSRGIGPVYLDRGGVRVLNQKCIRGHRVDVGKARRHDPSKRSIAGRLVRELDILVNSTGVGTLGRVAQIWSLREDVIVDSHVTVVRAADSVDPWFLGVGAIERESEIEALGEGSTGQTELSRARLGGLLCVRPPEALQRRFGAAVSASFRRVAANEEEDRTLARLRDDLLPRLLSGELAIESAERAVEALA